MKVQNIQLLKICKFIFNISIRNTENTTESFKVSSSRKSKPKHHKKNSAVHSRIFKEFFEKESNASKDNEVYISSISEEQESLQSIDTGFQHEEDPKHINCLK